MHLQWVFAFLSGTQVLLRGRMEHKNLSWGQFNFNGQYPLNHPDLPNQPCLEVFMTSMRTKGHRITLSNPHALNAEKPFRFPYKKGDKLNYAYIASLMRKACHPCQNLCYHKIASAYQISRYTKEDLPDVLYSHTQAMGSNTISKLIKNLSKRVGIDDWNKKTNHCLHQWALTTLSNDSNVNPAERQHRARHKSITAQNAYICPTATSEMACIHSLNPTIPALPSNNALGDTTEVPSDEPGSLIAKHLQPNPTGTQVTSNATENPTVPNKEHPNMEAEEVPTTQATATTTTSPTEDIFVLTEQFSDDDTVEQDRKPAAVERGPNGGVIL
jgi:hypothetical protein